MTEITIKKPRGTLDIYRDVIFTKRSGLKNGQSIPRIDVRQNNISIDMSKLSRYREVCGFDLSDRLPLTFPHILAFPLHMEAMVHETFPLKSIGLVHLRNEIRELKPLNAQMTLNCHVWIDGQREIDAGIEFDINTSFTSKGEVVWESTTTILQRRGGGGSDKKKTRQAPEPLGSNLHIENWKIPENMGRRYAGVSGDRNPIHLYPFTAKALGFKSHIVHGMWTKARTMAALEEYRPEGACSLAVQFKLPVFLPGKIQLQMKQENGQCVFEVRDGNGVKPHMTGSLTAL